jgi:hypothetical protein
MVISDADRTKTIQYSLETELKKLIYKEKREVNKVQIASLTTDLFTESSYDYSEQAMAFYAKIQPEEYDSYISILKKFTENKETNHQHYLATDDIVKCSLEKVKADRLSFWKKTEDK